MNNFFLKPLTLLLSLLMTLNQPSVFQMNSNCPLSTELQAHTYNICEEYEVPYNVILRIMYHESRFIPDVPDHINTNGSIDRGLMQINSCNWSWLEESYDLDISVPEDNIESGVLILSFFWDKYTPEEAIMAYQCGEQRMKELRESNITTKYAKEILTEELYEWEVGG